MNVWIDMCFYYHTDSKTTKKKTHRYITTQKVHFNHHHWRKKWTQRNKSMIVWYGCSFDVSNVTWYQIITEIAAIRGKTFARYTNGRKWGICYCRQRDSLFLSGHHPFFFMIYIKEVNKWLICDPNLENQKISSVKTFFTKRHHNLRRYIKFHLCVISYLPRIWKRLKGLETVILRQRRVSKWFDDDHCKTQTTHKQHVRKGKTQMTWGNLQQFDFYQFYM